jgi:hypothetical protein
MILEASENSRPVSTPLKRKRPVKMDPARRSGIWYMLNKKAIPIEKKIMRNSIR